MAQPRGPPTLALPQTPVAAAAPKQGEHSSAGSDSSSSPPPSQSATLRRRVCPNLAWQEIGLVTTRTMGQQL